MDFPKIALSSTEAEYMCLSDTAWQITWIESLFKEIGFNIFNFALCGDNQGAMFLAMNPAVETRSKHIDIKYHHIRECVIEKRVMLHFSNYRTNSWYHDNVEITLD